MLCGALASFAGASASEFDDLIEKAVILAELQEYLYDLTGDEHHKNDAALFRAIARMAEDVDSLNEEQRAQLFLSQRNLSDTSAEEMRMEAEAFKSMAIITHAEAQKEKRKREEYAARYDDAQIVELLIGLQEKWREEERREVQSLEDEMAPLAERWDLLNSRIEAIEKEMECRGEMLPLLLDPFRYDWGSIDTKMEFAPIVLAGEATVLAYMDCQEGG